MIQYLLEAAAFQLIFLLFYDLFLKKETFFQWNRAYLLFTFTLSLILQWVKIEALTFVVPIRTDSYPEFLWSTNILDGATQTTTESKMWQLLHPMEWVLILGAAIMTILLGYKIFRIQRFRKKGTVTYHSNFTEILVKRSTVAFSFFKQVFLGDGIPKDRVTQIISHELVHIKQWHSLDLLLFELLRIPLWFNPFVYIYQSRMVELHEFIADSVTVKAHPKGQYQLLLSEVFETKKISFINQFFKTSLIKKRIVMLRKKKSNQARLLKYLVLLPLFFMMVVYTSCETEEKKGENAASTQLMGTANTELVPFMTAENAPVFPGCENAGDVKNCFLEKIQEHVRKHFNYPKEAQDLGIEGRVAVMFTIDENGDIINIQKRGPHELLENEVERIIEKLPQMQPGKHKGEVVKVPFSLPVVFKLE